MFDSEIGWIWGLGFKAAEFEGRKSNIDCITGSNQYNKIQQHTRLQELSLLVFL
jgi:hypothetical protein